MKECRKDFAASTTPPESAAAIQDLEILDAKRYEHLDDEGNNRYADSSSIMVSLGLLVWLPEDFCVSCPGNRARMRDVMQTLHL